MKLVGCRLKETEFEGKKYEKYECHCVDDRPLKGFEGSRVYVYEVRPNILDPDFEFQIGGNYDFVSDDGKITAVFEV